MKSYQPETMSRILIVEDNVTLAWGIQLALARKGREVLVAASIEEAENQFTKVVPHLVLLDLGLPDGDGISLLKSIRSRLLPIKVVIISARTEISDRVYAFDNGADDYLCKPFAIEELDARVRYQLREHNDPRVWVGNIEVQFDNELVVKDGKRIRMSRREFRLLAYLVLHGGRTVSRSELFQSVWGFRRPIRSRTIDTHIWKLRELLEDDPHHPSLLICVRGEGYRVEGCHY